MSRCIILFKILTLFTLFRLFNCDDLINTFETEESIIIDEENTVTKEYNSQTVSYDIVEIATGDEVIVTDENNINVVCPDFQNLGEINLERMVGVWRPAYYQVSYKVPCFKMLIRNISSEEKKHYSKLYGSFNGKVIWDDCNLEIKSSANLVYRKHFLQGCEKGFGVLENIIIEQKGNAVPILIEENADQWLAINNLLLMRDCMSGETVIFSREAFQPKLNEVLEAMKKFGNSSKGEWACNDSGKTEKPKAFNGEFESENDIVFFE